MPSCCWMGFTICTMIYYNLKLTWIPLITKYRIIFRICVFSTRTYWPWLRLNNLLSLIVSTMDIVLMIVLIVSLCVLLRRLLISLTSCLCLCLWNLFQIELWTIGWRSYSVILLRIWLILLLKCLSNWIEINRCFWGSCWQR